MYFADQTLLFLFKNRIYKNVTFKKLISKAKEKTKPTAILITSTNDGSTLELIYLWRRVQDRKKWTNQNCVIQIELGGCKQTKKKRNFTVWDTRLCMFLISQAFNKVRFAELLNAKNRSLVICSTWYSGSV